MLGKYRRIRRNGAAGSGGSSGTRLSTLGLSPGDNLTIPVGQTYIVDATTVDLGVVVIAGTLTWDQSAAPVLNAGGIQVAATGRLEAGTSSSRQAGGIELIAAPPSGVIVGETHSHGDVSRSNPSDAYFGIDGLSRGIINQGGQIEIYGVKPSVTRTKLNAHASAGATSLTVEDSLSWPAGTNVMVAPTCFYDNGHTEIFTATGSGTSLTLSSGLSASRWGVMQHLTDSGIATSAGTFSTMRANANQRSTLDQRARVANLDRGFFIRGRNDAQWTRFRHGAHVMTMGLTSKTILDGVQFRRVGQGGKLGRYPIHWHILSYHQTTGANLGNVVAADHLVQDCVVWESANRAVTIHATRGVQVKNNVACDISGHAYFLEEGSEEDNVITGNWGYKVRDPNAYWPADPFVVTVANPGIFTRNGHGYVDGEPVILPGAVPGNFFGRVFSEANQFRQYFVVNATANTLQLAATFGGTPLQANSAPSGVTLQRNYRLKLHDATPAGAWITNCNNEFRLNAFGDCQNIGMWIALTGDRNGFPGGCFGASAQAAIHPFYTRPRIASDGVTPLFSDNECHSNGREGINNNFAAIDERGNTRDGNLPDSSPSSEGGVGGPVFRIPAQKSGTNVNGIIDRQYNWKNQTGGYQNRVTNPIYRAWVQADNLGTDFFGATQQSQGNEFQHPVGAGFSLNAEAAPPGRPTIRNMFASYHGAIDPVDITAYNYPIGTPSVSNHNLPYTTYGLLLGGGVLQGWDLYLRPLENELARSRNWRLLNCNPIFRTPPPHIINDAWDALTGNQPKDVDLGGGSTLRNWTIAGAVQDHWGVFGGPADSYNIFDHPFLTTGLSGSTLNTPSDNKTRWTTDPFYGVYVLADDLNFDFSTEFGWRPPTLFQRLDATTQAVVAGTDWAQGDGNASGSIFFQDQHHCVCPRDGWVKHTRPGGSPNATRFAARITNCKRVSGFDGASTTDVFYLAVHWSGSVAPSQVDAGYGGTFSTLTHASSDFAGSGTIFEGRAVHFASVASMALLKAAVVPSYFRDTVNNLLYLKIMPWSAGTTYNLTNVFNYDDSRGFNLYIKA